MNGLIIQFARVSGNGAHYFPINFPNTCVSISVAQSNKSEVSRVTSLSASKYEINCQGGSPTMNYIMAIGY